MFGFQRIGDLIWAAADMRVRGFLIGATAGRTTLNGEGLQHEDGHSHVLASTVPNLRTYDPAFAYELAIILRDGIKQMYEEGRQDLFYYITVYNENYKMLPMPEGKGVEEGVLNGAYKFRPSLLKKSPQAQLLGSGPILQQVLRAQEMLAEQYGVSADVWSVTSYKELRREALETDRWNMLHPGEKPKQSYVEQLFANEKGTFIAASDYMKSLPEMIQRWVPGGVYPLGTDGFGRSETREALRRHFGIDAESIVVATLSQLARKGEIKLELIKDAIKKYDVNPKAIDPVKA